LSVSFKIYPYPTLLAALVGIKKARGCRGFTWLINPWYY